MWTSELPVWLLAARTCAVACVGLLTFLVVYLLALVPAVEAPLFGVKGRRRASARTSSAFSIIEPVARQLAGWLRCIPLSGLRVVLTSMLRASGELAGLSADELVALSLLSVATLGLCAAWVIGVAGWDANCALLAVGWSAALPFLQVRSTARERATQLERSLPSAMDLCVLCMGAGSDFPAALRFVVDDLGSAHAVCREELEQVLDEIALGRTRLEALGAFGERTDSQAVREFVAAVCQSEKKGTPLIDALSIQASTLRQRRSVTAEELAAKAGVKMMAPMLLMVSSLLLIIFGPFIVNGLGL